MHITSRSHRPLDDQSSLHMAMTSALMTGTGALPPHFNSYAFLRTLSTAASPTPGRRYEGAEPRTNQFRSKVVCTLSCKHCETLLCSRGMKAILLANMEVELFSTDAPPQNIELVGDDYTTQECLCRIRDSACVSCGNVVGYHVVQACPTCLDAANNGHFFMFLCSETSCVDRTAHTDEGAKPMLWHNLPRSDLDGNADLYSKCMR